MWQCGEPGHDTTYDNETIIKKMVSEQENMRIPSGLIPHCPVCGAPMSMNLRADSTFVEDNGWHTAAKRYQDFVRRHKGLDILYLELGVGGNQRKPKRRTDSAARSWYEKEAYEQTWSVRTLQRNINTQYYYRILQSQHKDLVEQEMLEKTSDFQNDKLEFVKNPVIAEFLGLSSNTDFTETDLETSIISNIQKFLMEMGKGYAFVARQQHIKTEKEDYFIDLVFYNYILKCFVLIDLKTNKITHQDVGQMDMYIRMYDELKKGADDNPTLGIVLCTETDEDIARYSVLHGNEQLFASKYKLYLPTEEELRKEIEIQKTMFYLQQKEKRSEQMHGEEN